MISEVLATVNKQKKRKRLIFFSCKKAPATIHVKGEDNISVKTIGESAEEGKYKLTFMYRTSLEWSLVIRASTIHLLDIQKERV